MIRKLLNWDVNLRYLLKMIAIHPEDQDRKFILEYSLADGTLTISEIQTRNCGRTGRGFLAPTVVAKPSEITIGNEENFINLLIQKNSFLNISLNFHFDMIIV